MSFLDALMGHAYTIDDSAGADAIRRQAAENSQAIGAQAYGAAGAYGGNPLDVRNASNAAVRAQVASGNAAQIQQGQLAQQTQQYNAQAQQRADASQLQGIGTAVATGAMLSDARTKKNVRSGAPLVRIMMGGPLPAAASDAMSRARPVAYEYKDGYASGPDAAPGPHVGVMAQDLEKTPAGAQAVQRGPDGMRHLSTERLLPLLMAHGADVEQRLRKLEGR